MATVYDSVDCLVLGAGLASLTFIDRRVTATTDKIFVIEKLPHPGGIIRPITLNGVRFDVGPHILFQEDQDARAYWKSVLPGRVKSCVRSSSILYQGEIIDSPLRVIQAIRKIGMWTSLSAMASFARAAVGRRANGSAKDWVRSRYGKVLYEAFFASYNRKLWGVDMSEVSATWPDRRIKKSLLQMLWSALSRSQRTGVRTFDYADGGAASLVDAINQRIAQSPNVTVQCASVPTRIEVTGDYVTLVQTDDGSEFRNPKFVISSIPIDELMKCIAGAPSDAAQRLRWRSVITVNLVVPRDVDSWFNKQWVDIHDERLKCLRMTNFGLISETMASDLHTSICVEYCCQELDDLWNAPDQVLVDLAISDIRKAFRRSPEAVAAAFVCRIPKAYPVCLKSFDDDLYEIRQFTDTIRNLVPIGRSGTFQYNNMHEAINVGAYVADNLRLDIAPEVWSTFHFAMRHQE